MVKLPLRLWQRDYDVLDSISRSPHTTGQVARRHRFPSRKKAAERLFPFHKAGLVKRVPYFLPAMQGKPENVYYNGIAPHPRTIQHTIGVTEVGVQGTLWAHETPASTVEVLYTNEITTSNGLIPDATLIRTDVTTGRIAIVFFEIHRGTEPINSANGYSLAKKLDKYAEYFDTNLYATDFATYGTPKGFRVAIILPPALLPRVQRLVHDAKHDFVLLTTPDEFVQGMQAPIWRNHAGDMVDILGQPKELVTGES